MLVRGGMSTSVVVRLRARHTAGLQRAWPSDGFDRWCASRDDADRVHDRYAAQGDEPSDVPDEVRPYYGELVDARPVRDVDPDYGTVWYPTGVRTTGAPTTTATGRTVPAATSGSRTSRGAGLPITTATGSGPPAIAGAGSRDPSSPARGSPGRGARSASAGRRSITGAARAGSAGRCYYGYYDPALLDVRQLLPHQRPQRPSRTRFRSTRSATTFAHATVVARAPRVDPRRIAGIAEWRDRALREVADDRSARMSPIQADRRPERKLSDVQNHLMRRSAQQAAPSERLRRDTAGAPSVDPRATRAQAAGGSSMTRA